ncbi:gtpase-activating protein [Anaeramoeba ignava]|uniref:Gtpase-activating protein n=1 Tax=Anaeramoeba ignava TaxID=1746090 RepID=A0A9Q0LUF2_ANAIG|nr:gtpase-activating protein [Anaeramoeba ignava]
MEQQKIQKEKEFKINSKINQVQFFQDLQYLDQVKKKVLVQLNSNYELEKQVINYDHQISHLLQKQISTAQEGLKTQTQNENISIEKEITKKIIDEQKYVDFIFLLYYKPIYISKIIHTIPGIQSPKFLEIVMNSIYEDQESQNTDILLSSTFNLSLHEEFKKNQYLNTILRSNSTLSKILTRYTRRNSGINYLKEVLSDFIQSIATNEEQNLEINPIKIYEEIYNENQGNNSDMKDPKEISYGECENFKEITNRSKKRLIQLQKFFEQLVDNIFQSVEKIPKGIRLICKRIRDFSQEFLTEINEFSLTALVGGFFILRFINPAIVGAKSLDIIEKDVNSDCKRTSVLLAKMLQNLSNMVDIFEDKEKYMTVFRDIILSKRNDLISFINSICKVEEYEIDEEIIQFNDLLSGAPEISIRINDIYFLHELFSKNIDEIGLDLNDPLKNLLNSLGSVQTQIPAEQNYLMKIPLKKSITSTIGHRKSSYFVIYKDTLLNLTTIYHEIQKKTTKNEILKYEKFIKILNQIRQEAKNFHNLKMNNKIKHLLSNIKILIRERVILPENDFQKLHFDVQDILSNIKETHSKIFEEINLLEKVHSYLLLQRKPLQTKKDSYPQYLANINVELQTKPTLVNRSKSMKMNPKSRVLKKQFFEKTHEELEKSGVLVSSAIPEERQEFVYFVFRKTEKTGIYLLDVMVQQKKEPLETLTLLMRDLLQDRLNSKKNFDLEYLKLDVEKMIKLLEEYF